MEQFKICEKETKTKTYSKEGLARQERLSPEEQAKYETTSWIGDIIERLGGLRAKFRSVSVTGESFGGKSSKICPFRAVFGSKKYTARCKQRTCGRVKVTYRNFGQRDKKEVARDLSVTHCPFSS